MVEASKISSDDCLVKNSGRNDYHIASGTSQETVSLAHQIEVD